MNVLGVQCQQQRSRVPNFGMDARIAHAGTREGIQGAQRLVEGLSKVKSPLAAAIRGDNCYKVTLTRAGEFIREFTYRPGKHSLRSLIDKIRASEAVFA